MFLPNISLIGVSGQDPINQSGTQSQISRSLRFFSSSSKYLNRTFGTPTNQKQFTLSLWCKRTTLSSAQQLFGVSTNHSFGFTSGDALNITLGGTSILTTTSVFRDPAAWYHIVWTQNGTNHTVYVNNNIVGSATGTSTVFNTAVSHQIGAVNAGTFFNGYLSNVHFIDGQVLTPSFFGKYDSNNIWQPITYSGTYGNNGFYLPLSNNSSTTTLGADSSSNANNWTLNNFSVGAGRSNDSLVDSPTNYGTDTGVGGEVRGNYATLNPFTSTVSISNGNLDYSSTTVGQVALSTLGLSSGKWYWEVSTTAGTTETRVGLFSTTATSLYSLAANNTVYGLRFDAGAGTLDYTTNGSTWTSLATSLTSGPYFPYFNNNGTTAKTVSVNFGQRPFNYTAPSTYKAVSTQNIPTPAILNGRSVMDVVTYVGNGTSQDVRKLNFNPDLVILRNRTEQYYNTLVYDSIRGPQSNISIPLTTSSETTNDSGLLSFENNGFTLGNLTTVNNSNSLFVGWCWDSGSSTSNNSSGSISSSVRANPSCGFSVVSYTGTGSAGTVGHGLSAVPKFIWVKPRSTSTMWYCYHSSITNPQSSYTRLNNVSNIYTDTTAWNNTLPTSTVFSVGSFTGTNQSSVSFIAHCWTDVPGYSSFGKYSGNSSTDGPFIYTGFKPRYIMIFGLTGGQTGVVVWDSERFKFNPNTRAHLGFGNQIEVEQTSANFGIDILSNGFKLRSGFIYVNTTGYDYLYAAFAENPFSIARAN